MKDLHPPGRPQARGDTLEAAIQGQPREHQRQDARGTATHQTTTDPTRAGTSAVVEAAAGG